MSVANRARAEQHATRAAFFIPGFATALWATLVPFAKARTGINDATLGLVLLCLGAGSLLAMPLSGVLAARLGCRRVMVASSLLICLTVPGLALAGSAWTLGLVLFVLVIAACWGYSQIFSGRAAYIHTGALIGTIMVGNVFRIIMPAQRALVAAIEQNRTPDPVLPAKGLLRSRHNNYFTLPVLFIMISNHFPSTYGSQYNWLIAALVFLMGVTIRHFFNTKHARKPWPWWTWGVTALLFAGIVWLSTVGTQALPDEESDGPAQIDEYV